MKIETYFNKIIKYTRLSKEEIQNFVEAKKEQLDGLISDEGALYIIANLHFKRKGRAYLILIKAIKGTGLQNEPAFKKWNN